MLSASYKNATGPLHIPAHYTVGELRPWDSSAKLAHAAVISSREPVKSN